MDWTDSDNDRWHDLCSRDPETLTNDELVEGFELSYRLGQFTMKSGIVQEILLGDEYNV